LGLLPGPWTPSLQEGAVRLGAWMPFPAAAALLGTFAHTALSEPSVRRKAEEAGAAYVAVQAAAVAALEQRPTAPPDGPAVLQLSADGAMVPLVGKGAWAEVKTVAIGAVQPPAWEQDKLVVHATDLSYFSRLADHEAFTRLALVETHRRGVATAGVVAAVSDGAGWIQGFVDYHRPDAVRILDWCHAAGYLGKVATACFGAEVERAGQWLAAQARELLEGDPEKVLGKLRGLRDGVARAAGGEAAAKREVLDAALEYLEARRAQIAYAAFRALGYPIGSGVVESANKLIVEARLKGAGMHWARGHVDGMVALRTVVCADRWGEAWPQIAAELRRQARQRLRQKRQARRAAAAPAPPPPAPVLAADPAGALALPTGRHDEAPPGHDEAAAPLGPPVPAARPRPGPRHPWRRYPQPATVN
jgi:hypothetical protein